MMCGMQAPEQCYLMSKIMIYKMCEFPYNIAVNQPIPGILCFKYGIFFEKAYTKCNGGYGNKPGKNAVEYVNEKNNLIMGDPEPFVDKRPDNFNDQ